MYSECGDICHYTVYSKHSDLCHYTVYSERSDICHYIVYSERSDICHYIVYINAVNPKPLTIPRYLQSYRFLIHRNTSMHQISEVVCPPDNTIYNIM